MHISRREFESLVEEALAKLPKRFAALLENIAVVVEDEPTDDDLDEVFGDEDEDDNENREDAEPDADELLGIFRGTPLTQRRHDDLPQLPAEVAIFRGPILRVARDRREAVQEIRDTVIHELGHYFGLGDDEMVY